MKYEDLPDTITPLDYAKWRNVGETTARNIFNSKGFPRLRGTGVKQLADKRAVLIYELNLYQNKDFIEGLAKSLMKGGTYENTNENQMD